VLCVGKDQNVVQSLVAVDSTFPNEIGTGELLRPVLIYEK
jgi:hypothetical protein